MIVSCNSCIAKCNAADSWLAAYYGHHELRFFAVRDISSNPTPGVHLPYSVGPIREWHLGAVDGGCVVVGADYHHWLLKSVPRVDCWRISAYRLYQVA
jgi:hypothetical protein